MLQTFQKIALRNCLVSSKLFSEQCDHDATKDITGGIFNNALLCAKVANGHLKAILKQPKQTFT